MTSSPAAAHAESGLPPTQLSAWWPALVCALAGAAVFQFFGNANHGYIATDSLFWWWIFQWINPASETEHGWLILGIAGWLLWRNVRVADRGFPIAERGWTKPETGDRKPVSAEGSGARRVRLWGAPMVAMIGALALHTVAFAAQQARVSIVALLLFTWGVLRLGGGPRWGRAAVFPTAFLVFAIPINVLDSVGFWLRMWVIDASTSIAHLAHIPVVQNGTQLLAPDGRYNYDVAAACSGVRSLMALAALSLLIGYVSFSSWRRRAVVFLLCFPLVYVGNVARITAIVIAAQVAGPAWGDRAHAVMGYAIFVIVLGGVLVAAKWLTRVSPELPVRGTADGRETGDRRQGTGDGRQATGDRGQERDRRDEGTDEGEMRPARPYLVAAVVTMCAVSGMLVLHAIAVRPPRGEVGVVLSADGKNPIDLPAFLGREWMGWPAPVTQIEREILPLDTGFSRVNYVDARQSQRVFLSIVLSGRDRTSIHRPELCLVGQGWTLTGRASHRFSYPGRGDASFPATILHVRRDRTASGPAVPPQLVAYWFVAGDRVVANHWSRIAYDAYNRVVHGRVDRWAYVLLQTDASDGEAAALARLQGVLNATLPSFQKPFPIGGGKKDVGKQSDAVSENHP